MSGYEELVEAVARRRLASGLSVIARGKRSDQEWFVDSIAISEAGMFLAGPFRDQESAEMELELIQARADISIVLRTLETVTPEMRRAAQNAPATFGWQIDEEYLSMLHVSPLTPPL